MISNEAKQSLTELRAFIAELPEVACDMDVIMQYPRATSGFRNYIAPIDMKKNNFSCGTAGCFKGWAQVKAVLEPSSPNNYSINAEDYLNLTFEEKELLFFTFPNKAPRTWKEWILTRLDTIIETGEIVNANLGNNYDDDKVDGCSCDSCRGDDDETN